MTSGAGELGARAGTTYTVRIPDTFDPALRAALEEAYPETYTGRAVAGVLHHELGDCAPDGEGTCRRVRLRAAQVVGLTRCGTCEERLEVPLRRALGELWHLSDLAGELALADALLRRGGRSSALAARLGAQVVEAEQWPLPSEAAGTLLAGLEQAAEALEGGADDPGTRAAYEGREERVEVVTHQSTWHDTVAPEQLGKVLQELFEVGAGAEGKGILLLPQRAVPAVLRSEVVGWGSRFARLGRALEGDTAHTYAVLVRLWADGMLPEQALRAARMLTSE